VSDVNDHKPQFEREEYSADLVENNYVGAVIITVSESIVQVNSAWPSLCG